MRNIIILSVFLLILYTTMFLASCDDFFSPTIEIFNEIKNPNVIELEQGQSQNQEQKKKKEQSVDIINQQF